MLPTEPLSDDVTFNCSEYPFRDVRDFFDLGLSPADTGIVRVLVVPSLPSATGVTESVDSAA